MFRKKLLLIVATSFIIMAVWSFAFARADMPLVVMVNPDKILMGATFNGTHLSVSGKVPVGSEVLVRVVGKRTNLKLKKKEHALGLLWMNLGTVEFQNVPSVYLLVPSKAVEQLSINRKDRWQKLGLGFTGLEKQIGVIPLSEDKHKLFMEFYRLKQSEGLYGIQRNSVRYENDSNHMKTFYAVISIPSDIPQGIYSVQTFVMKNGIITARTEEKIEAKEVGFPATISFLAFNYPTLYGVLAVIIALVAGLITGFVFKESGGGH